MPVFTPSSLRAPPDSSSNVTFEPPGNKNTTHGSSHPPWLAPNIIYIAVAALAVLGLVRLVSPRIFAPSYKLERRKPRGHVLDLPRDLPKRESFANPLDQKTERQKTTAGEGLGRFQGWVGKRLLSAAPVVAPVVTGAGALPLSSLLAAAGLQQGQGGLASGPATGSGLLNMEGSRDDGSRGVSRSVLGSSVNIGAADPSRRSGSSSRHHHGQPHQHRHSHRHRQNPDSSTSSTGSASGSPPLLSPVTTTAAPTATAAAAVASAARAAVPLPVWPPSYHQLPRRSSPGRRHFYPNAYPPSAGVDGRTTAQLTRMGGDGYIATERAAIPPLLPPLSTQVPAGDFDYATSPFPRRFSRPPPLPPLTPPRLSTAVFTFEDRRPSYAISIPPELDFDTEAPGQSTDFIHQPNPDYLAASADEDLDEDHYGQGDAYQDGRYTADDASTGEYSPTAHVPSPRARTTGHQHSPRGSGSGSGSGSGLDSSATRKRSYAKSRPVGITVPVTVYHELPGTHASSGDFAPSSYPPSSPRLPPPPPGWEESFGYEMYEGTEEVVVPFAGPSTEAGYRLEEEGATGAYGAVDGTETAKSRKGSSSKKAIDVQGEIISAVDDTGAGWKRHTRVYGGGVCLACAAAGGHGGSGGGHGGGGGGFYGERVRPEEKR